MSKRTWIVLAYAFAIIPLGVWVRAAARPGLVYPIVFFGIITVIALLAVEHDTEGE